MTIELALARAPQDIPEVTAKPVPHVRRFPVRTTEHVKTTMVLARARASWPIPEVIVKQVPHVRRFSV